MGKKKRSYVRFEARDDGGGISAEIGAFFSHDRGKAFRRGFLILFAVGVGLLVAWLVGADVWDVLQAVLGAF